MRIATLSRGDFAEAFREAALKRAWSVAQTFPSHRLKPGARKSRLKPG
jgi:hypothetical protein